MSHWSFVVAAYAIALGATSLLLLTSWRSMISAEARAEAAKRQ